MAPNLYVNPFNPDDEPLFYFSKYLQLGRISMKDW